MQRSDPHPLKMKLEALVAAIIENVHTPEGAKVLYGGARMAQAFSVFGLVSSGLTRDLYVLIYSLGVYVISGNVARHFENYRRRKL